MKLSIQIARRYLFGKKSRSAINYISGVSVAVVAIVTMALFTILSVFNGLNQLISSMFNTFDADLKISLNEGKYFNADSVIAVINDIDEIKTYSLTLEEDVLLRYGQRQFIATAKGVDTLYNSVSGIDSMLTRGEFILQSGSIQHGVVGQMVAYRLGVGLNFIEPLMLYAPDRFAKPGINPQKSFRKEALYPSGIFTVQQDIDSKYIITSLELMQNLLRCEGMISNIEVKLTNPSSEEATKQLLKQKLGNRFTVQNRFEQHEFVYKVIQSEKWAIFLIVTFILIIASFNIIASLSMLIIEKKKDIAIFASMGADIQFIRKVFLFEGWLISALGAAIGLTLGFIICWIQETFGIIPFQSGGNFFISSYPVDMQFSDAIASLGIVLLIGLLVAFVPVRLILPKVFKG